MRNRATIYSFFQKSLLLAFYISHIISGVAKTTDYEVLSLTVMEKLLQKILNALAWTGWTE